MFGWHASLLIGCLWFLGNCQLSLAANAKTTYLITVETSPDMNAEPAQNDQVFVKLVGEQGETMFKELERVVGSFNRSSESQFSVTARNVGIIKEVTVNKTATGPKEAWKLKKLLIEDSKGTVYEFVCKCWISKGQGLLKTLKPNKITYPNAKPTSASTSATPSGSTANSSSTPTSSPGPTNGEESTQGIGETTISKPTTSNGTTELPTSPTSAKPSGASTPAPGSSGEKATTSISSKTTSEPSASTGVTSGKPSTVSSSGTPSGPTTSSSGTSGRPTSASTKGKPSLAAKKPSSRRPTNEKVTVSTGAGSSGPTSKPSASTEPTSEKPTPSSGPTTSGPNSKPSASTGLTSEKPTPSSGPTTSGPNSKPSASTGPTSEKPTPSSGPTTSEPKSKPPASTGPTSEKPTSSSGPMTSEPKSKPSASTGPTSEKPIPSSSPMTSGPKSKPPASTGPTSEKPTPSSSPMTSGPKSKPPASTGPTSEKPTPSSSAMTSGPKSKPPASTGPTSEKPTPSSGGSKTLGPNSKPSASTGPTSEKPTPSSGGSKTLGPNSKPPASASSKPTPSGPLSTKPSGLSSAKPSGPTSGKPSGPLNTKPSVPSNAKPSGPTSGKPSGPASAKPSGQTSAKPSGTTSAKPVGNSTTKLPQAGPSIHSAFMYDLLREMNTMRLLHGAGPLLLEKNMSRAAQKEAVKISKRGTVNDETESIYGINTCKLLGVAPDKNGAKQCVSRWYETVKDFDWPNPLVTAKSAQFTRLVWKPTTHVGIGVSGSNVVVYFDPPSNQIESAKSNISPVTDLSDGTSQVCPEGFKISGKSCYRFNPTPSTWEKAIEECAHHGATLASLQSQEENTFIAGMISGLENSETSEAWLGFNDRITESRYQWIDGSVVSFHQFLPTEPTGVGENCVALKHTKNETGWEDKKCSDKLPSLCRRPAEGPITFKITFLIEVVNQVQNAVVKSVVPQGEKDHATLIKEKINSASNNKPVEFVGESTETGTDGGNYFSVFIKTPTGSDVNIVQPLQDYLDTHNNHISPGSKDKVYVVSVTVNNPANGMCYSTCFTTCSNQCNPMCCSGSFIVNPSAFTQPQVSSYQQQTQPNYNNPNPYQYSSSYHGSYLPQYPYPYSSAQQNGLASRNSYMVPNTQGCVRACTRITRGEFCPPYCPKRCCGLRIVFRPRIY